jgi:chromosome segregation ATPase
MGIEKTHYNNLMSEIRGMREEIGRIDRDLCRDRQDMEDFKVQMATMKEEIKQLRGELMANADKVKDRVVDALEPAVKEVSKLKNEIKNKKRIIVFKRGFFQWLKAKLGGEKYGNN